MPSAPEKEFPEVWSKLCNARRTGRLGHAYCLVGDDAQLLEKFGRRWARVCACRGVTSSGDACGDCPSCVQIDRGAYAEMFELRPQSKSRRILVDEIRDFEHSLQLTTGANRTKVGIIAEADRLVVQAQNAFLKTLEEPPRNVVLILLTTQPRGLLPTIRSRCQTVSIRTNKKEYTTELLREVFPLLHRMRRGAGSDVALAAAAALKELFMRLNALAEDNLSDSLTPENEEEIEQDNRLQKRLENVQDARIKAEYLRLRQEVVEAIQVWFLQQSLLAHGAPEAYIPNPEMLEAAGVAATAVSDIPAEEAENNVQKAVELARDFASNVDERLALESFCLTICKHSSN